MKERKKRENYTRELRRQIEDECIAEGKLSEARVEAVIRKYNILPATLHRWLKERRDADGIDWDSPPYRGRRSSVDELRQMMAPIVELTEAIRELLARMKMVKQ